MDGRANPSYFYFDGVNRSFAREDAEKALTYFLHVRRFGESELVTAQRPEKRTEAAVTECAVGSRTAPCTFSGSS